MNQPETASSNDLRLFIGRVARNVRLFRNHAGLFWAGKVKGRQGSTVVLENASQIAGGLVVGASDTVGWVSIIITPEMVGQRFARFTAIEVKVVGGPGANKDQQTFIRNVTEAGGIAGVVRTREDVIALLGIDPASLPAVR